MQDVAQDRLRPSRQLHRQLIPAGNALFRQVTLKIVAGVPFFYFQSATKRMAPS